jgi:hypothetical protein
MIPSFLAIDNPFFLTFQTFKAFEGETLIDLLIRSCYTILSRGLRIVGSIFSMQLGFVFLAGLLVGWAGSRMTYMFGKRRGGCVIAKRGSEETSSDNVVMGPLPLEPVGYIIASNDDVNSRFSYTATPLQDSDPRDHA